jgi:hypothetical protein
MAEDLPGKGKPPQRRSLIAPGVVVVFSSEGKQRRISPLSIQTDSILAYPEILVAVNSPWSLNQVDRGRKMTNVIYATLD